MLSQRHIQTNGSPTGEVSDGAVYLASRTAFAGREDVLNKGVNGEKMLWWVSWKVTKKIETKYELRATNREVRQCSSSYENTNYMDVGALSGEHDSSLTSLHIQCPIVCGYSNELRVKQRPVSFMRNSLAGDVTQNVKWRRDASSWLSFMTHLWYKIYLHYRTLLLSRLKCHFCKSSKYQVPAVAFCSSDGHIAAM